MNFIREAIIRKYRIPVKRLMMVRHARTAEIGKIVGYAGNGLYLKVRFGRRRELKLLHPGDLDYFYDGEWHLGQNFIAAHNAYWDELNKSTRVSIKVSGLEMEIESD